MAKAYGSITIVDIGDLGQLTVVPESNQPTVVINDPDTGNYTPNWGEINNELELTPVIYYAGVPVKPEDATILWYIRKNSGTTDLLPGQEENITITDGKLKVQTNLFEDGSTSLLTFTVKVTYKEKKTNIQLESQGQITFSLVKNASKTKTVTITGENVFLYNSLGKPDKDSITLTARLEQCSVSNWLYKTKEGWSNLSYDRIKPTEVIINEADDIFINDVAVIKLETTVSGLYDDYTITKLRDGASGSSVVSVVLSNEDQMIPCNPDGSPITGDKDNPINPFAQAVTMVFIYEGNSDVTKHWAINYTTSSTSITVTKLNSEQSEYQVTAWTANNELTGHVLFTCHPKYIKTSDSTPAINKSYYLYNSTIDKYVKQENIESFDQNLIYYEDNNTTPPVLSLSKKFTLTKITTGADGTSPTIYSLEASSLVANASQEGKYTPTSITFNAYKWTGSQREDFDGQIVYKADDLGFKGNISGAADSSYIYTFGQYENPKNKLTFYLYPAGADVDSPETTYLDIQTIVITSDGATGKPGDPGASAVNYLTDNGTIIIPCNNNGSAKASTFKIGFSRYEGITNTSMYVVVSDYSEFNTTSLTISNSGKQNPYATLKLTEDQSITSDSGTIVFNVGPSEEVTDQQISVYWSKNIQAADGRDNIYLYIQAPNGNIINNNENDVKLEAKLLEGIQDVTSTTGLTYKWSKLKNGEYESYGGKEDTSLKSNEILVDRESVDTYASFKCEVEYGTDSSGNRLTHTAYISVQDRSDPLQIELVSTLGDKITNSQGVGALYARVYRNGEELDKLPTYTFSTDSTLTGTYYYLNQSKKEVVLKNSTESESKYKYNYKWTLRNGIQGNSIGTKTERILYIDSTIINTKTIFDLEVSENSSSEV